MMQSKRAGGGLIYGEAVPCVERRRFVGGTA